jgi:hypothetical protein
MTHPPSKQTNPKPPPQPSIKQPVPNPKLPKPSQVPPAGPGQGPYSPPKK